MKSVDEQKALASLEFEYVLDAPLQKVWRAISIAEFRNNWLPQSDLSEAGMRIITPEREVLYRMREKTPPFLESDVTFRITADTTGGTRLKITHELNDTRTDRMTEAANNNRQVKMLAA